MSTRTELAHAIRVLAMDAVQQANSGHPGAPMGMADIAEVLWNDLLKHNPNNPAWIDRDRFVLSNGHGSMLLYALLHLTGYDLSIEDLKQFRQFNSKTPGHPEYGYTPGVETTTGPLGQGITNAVGMALAEKILAAQFNQPGYNIIDHHTYVFVGDGCLMEGISHEACSLAGALGLGKLIVIYDDNNISIDGEVRGHGSVPGWFLDDTPQRFTAYGWHVIPKINGHDPAEIKTALLTAREVTDRPSLLCCQTIIGYGSPNKQGKEDCHGAALGATEVALTRENLGWKHPPFVIPEDIYQDWNAKTRGAALEATWDKLFANYQQAYPIQAAELTRRMKGELPLNWVEQADAFITQVIDKAETIASRKASQNALNGFGPLLPELLGGSADLAGSNLTLWKNCKGVSKNNASGNYIYYGVREFGMSAILNGIALHGGFIPYGATFLMFSEYARNAIRMAALMKAPAIFVYTHDSIGLGEDGPTHQPVEQIPTLRMIPNLSVWRPCDAVESAVAWKLAIERRTGPTSLIFSRQNLVHFTRSPEQIENIAKGGYILRDCAGLPDVILIATGSEVELAVQAAEILNQAGKAIRVVSMPATDVFDAQTPAYRESVLPQAVTARVAIEAAVTMGWWKYVGTRGAVLGIDRFGESAPAPVLLKHYGFTVENLLAIIKNIL